LLIAEGAALEDAGTEEKLIKQILKVFGVSTVSRAWRIRTRELTEIREVAVTWMQQRLREGCPVTFKVFGKRADKTYPLTSPELAADVGGAILEAYPNQVRVDVKNPEVSLYVHLRRKDVLIFDDSLKGFGGLPLGTNGKGLVLLSGGIDSPVAAWLMAKRGMQIEAVHFHSYPYTSKRAEEKVCDLADILAAYCGNVKVHILNLLPAQEALAAKCPENEMTILVRRFMVRIAEKIALREGCDFLITGENLGQVASQTAEGIAVTDRAAKSLPILRPLIAMDKVDIMALAQEIGTYETSILPYEDCCTVFLPKHPSTKPTLARIEASEALLDGPEDVNALEDAVLADETVFEAGRS
jgi:thiamine biosynthesis protein ThiI